MDTEYLWQVQSEKIKLRQKGDESMAIVVERIMMANIADNFLHTITVS